MPPDPPPTLGVILAGGLARRMGGGDKALRVLGGRPLLARLIERVRPQVAGLVLNANDDPARFAPFGLPVIPDTVPDRPGPLAGVLAALDWAAEQGAAEQGAVEKGGAERRPAGQGTAGQGTAGRGAVEWVVSLPGDSPFLPPDLVRRLHAARVAPGGGAAMACAVSGRWTHPVIGLWPVSIRGALRRALVEEGQRKIDAFTTRFGCATAEWPIQPADPFFNVNTPEDLAEAERLIAAHPAL